MVARARTGRFKRLLDALEAGVELDVETAMEIAFLSRRSAYRYLDELVALRLVHVDRYDKRGPNYVPIYAAGRKGHGARVPKPEDNAARQRTYRERHRVPRMSEIERALQPRTTEEDPREVS